GQHVWEQDLFKLQVEVYYPDASILGMTIVLGALRQHGGLVFSIIEQVSSMNIRSRSSTEGQSSGSTVQWGEEGPITPQNAPLSSLNRF
ncbi:hypothetical protein STEG23_020364, partial [Scotinomys teguina]